MRGQTHTPNPETQNLDPGSRHLEGIDTPQPAEEKRTLQDGICDAVPLALGLGVLGICLASHRHGKRCWEDATRKLADPTST